MPLQEEAGVFGVMTMGEVAMLRIVLSVIVVSCMTMACTTKNSSGKMSNLNALDKKDHALSCREILFEIDEASQYLRNAQRGIGSGAGNMVLPIGYISTSMDKEKAMRTADARVRYLKRIYGIMHCGQQSMKAQATVSQAAQEQVSVVPVAVPRPQYTYVNPVAYQEGVVYPPNYNYVPPMSYNPHNFW